MTSIKLYEQITLPTLFTDEIINSIKLVEIDFYFGDLHLIKSLIRLFNYTINAYHLEIRRTPRDAAIKKELHDINKLLTKANASLKQASLKSHLSFTNMKNHTLLNRFQSDLPDVIDEINKAINELRDNGGRPKYSIQEFITSNLLIIYYEGKKKIPTCGWDENEGNGVGDAFNFLITMRKILPKINPNLKLSNKNKSLCNTAIEVLSKLKETSIFESYQ